MEPERIEGREHELIKTEKLDKPSDIMKVERIDENEERLAKINFEKIKIEKHLNTELIIKEEIFDGGHIEDGQIKNETFDYISNIKSERVFESEERLTTTFNDENIKIEKQLNTELIIKDEILDESDLEAQRALEIESDENQFACYVCDKIFKNQSELIQHNHVLVQHKRTPSGENPFLCDVCNKRFTTQSSLVKHKRIHTGEKPFSCNICNKSFSDPSSFVRHKRIHSGEKPFACDICNKTFATRSNLAQHRRIHSGEKPFSCDICYKSLSGRTSLVRHKRKHSGEKPFLCDICNKSFSQRDALVSHKRIHSGEKPFSCDICNKSFTQKGSLVKHQQIHKK